jgi:RsiW-degrading membrane proteinase PrsW (M82 family)
MEDRFIIPTTKQRAVALLKALAPLIAAYALVVASRFYASSTAGLSVCAQLPWVRVAVLVGISVLVTLGCLSYRSGTRIWKSGQSPAPGTSVLFKRRAYTGWMAKSEAITMFAFTAFSAVALAALLKFFVFSEAGLFIAGLRACGP